MDERQAQYKAQIIDYGKGVRNITGLPVEDKQFWAYVIRLSARPGRRSDKSPFIGAAAEQLLRQRLARESSGIRESAALSLLADPNPRVRQVSVRQLAKSATSAGLQSLRHAAFGRDKDVAVEALHIIARQASKEAYEVLAAVLVHSNDIRSTIASEELIRAGPAAIPFLEELLDSPDRNIRWRTLSCIIAIGGPETLQSLLGALHDDSVDVARLAADGLLALGPTVHSDVLSSVLATHLSVATARALRHYAGHSEPHQPFRGILEATHGLASLTAIPVAVENALLALKGTPTN